MDGSHRPAPEGTVKLNINDIMLVSPPLWLLTLDTVSLAALPRPEEAEVEQAAKLQDYKGKVKRTHPRTRHTSAHI